MMWLTTIVLCAAGMVILGEERKTMEKETRKEPEKYSYEYCRENLKVGYYTDWNCHDISKQLKDNWVKDDVEYLMRNGLSFEYAIDEMMEEGKIKL